MEGAGSPWERANAHHLPSANDELGSSGQLELARPASAEVPSLRSVAILRSSRSGTEGLPFQPAEDLIAQDEYPGRNDLRARPPAAPSPAAPGRKSRRASIADFFGLGTGTGSASTGLSASRSRDITLQGMSSVPSVGRNRRASFLATFGLTPGGAAADHESAVGSADEASVTKSAASVGGQSQGRRRRASMFSLLRPSQNFDGALEGGEGVSASGPSLTPSKASVGRKSRRASVMDFFRFSGTGFRTTNTGLTAADEGASGALTSRSSRGFRPELGSSVGRSQRRRSIVDILGHSSKKVLAKLMNQEFDDDGEGEEDDDDGRLWFTSLNDFKPLTFKYLTGRYSSAFFACSVRTGQHYILKQFEKGKMSLADERGVRRALAFAQMLEHEHIVRCCGTWEDEDALYIVEEYAIKGDLLQDSMSHPEKYTEAFMATKVVKPLLEVLVYLHHINIVHRSIFPEYVLFGREDALKLGHFTSAIDQRLDPPNERIPFLDYMAPEMLAVRQDDAALPGFSTPAGRAGRTLSSHSTRVVRMQGYSNDGGGAPGATPTHPHSHLHPRSGDGTPGGGGGGLGDAESPGSGGGGGGRSALLWPTNRLRRAQSSSGGLLAGSSPGELHSGSSARSPVSRAPSRSPLNLSMFKSSRRLSPLAAQQSSEGDDVLAFSGNLSQFGGRDPSFKAGRAASMFGGGPGGGGGGVGSSGAPSRQPSRPEAALDAPWLLPHESSRSLMGMGASPIRRRKSQLEEMSAPWLRPLDNTTPDVTDDDGGEPPAAALPAAEGSVTAPAHGAGGGPAAAASTAASGVAAPAELGAPSAVAAAAASADDGAQGADSADQVSSITGMFSEASGVVGPNRSEDGTLVGSSCPEETRVHSMHGSGWDTRDGAPPPPRAPSVLMTSPESSSGQHGAYDLRLLSPSPQEMIHSGSYLSQPRRTDSLLQPPLRSGDSTRMQPPPPTALSPVLPQHLQALPSMLHPPPSYRRQSSVVRPGSADRRLPPPPSSDGGQEQEGSLPGYAAEPFPPPPPPAAAPGSRPASSRCSLNLEATAAARAASARPGLSRLVSASPLSASTLAAAPPFATPVGAGGAGPVMESLLVDPSTPESAASGGGGGSGYNTAATPSPSGHRSMRRNRTGVSFTTATTGGDESLATDVMADDEGAAQGRPSRLRVASREMSVGAGSTGASSAGPSSAGQVMMTGLRTLVRNVTRIGNALGGRGSEGPSSSNLDGLAAEATDGGGAGGGGGAGTGSGGAAPEATPRQSTAGGGGAEATSIFVPTNAWEWQDHYNEKVDLWQVGCLVHEILCLSLPFEAKDKMLACALILWADIVSFPDHLSPECHSFMRACLTKNPAERPSASELLQHPWITRHAAGETLKSVREQREEDSLAAQSNVTQLTWVQRAAAAVWLGWLVGVPGAAGAAGAAAAAGPLARLRQWTAKVLPIGSGAGADEGSKEGEAAFERAVAMVQEQQAFRRSSEIMLEASHGGKRHSVESAGGRRHSMESAGGKRHSMESAGGVRHSMESAGGGRRSMESAGGGRRSMDSAAGKRHSLDAMTHAHALAMGQTDATARWQVVL